jgi:A/G-specific adenine glycosylase
VTDVSSPGLVEPVLRWYDESARDLPWRAADRTPWAVLVSEVMLQQTPVARVEPVWREWMRRWPTPADLAVASPADAVREWGRLGYPRRALRLQSAARQIIERHAGEVPRDLLALRALDGIGEYTAAAVATFAFGGRHAVVDTNVRRVLVRAVDGRALPAPVLTAAERKLAEGALPADDGIATRWAVAVMELGALVCTARSPRCGSCPVADRCAWRLAGSPPYEGPPRRAQSWQGTDRQVRGRLLAALRAADPDIPLAELKVAVPDDDLRDPLQRERCLAALVEDGLAEPVPPDRYRLPA